MARKAVDDLNNDAITFIPDSASWMGHLSFQGSNDSHTFRAYLHPEGNGGSVRLDPKETKSPEWSKALKDWNPISEEDKTKFEQHALSTVQNKDVRVSSLSLKNYPKVRFQVLYNGVVHTVKLKMNGSLDVEEGSGSASIRRKLLRLHVMHGSPGYIGVRWLWARIVDIMGIAMIMWGVTGMIMWWMMRSTRTQGLIALSLGSIVIVTLAVSIWITFGML